MDENKAQPVCYSGRPGVELSGIPQLFIGKWVYAFLLKMIDQQIHTSYYANAKSEKELAQKVW